MARRSGSTNGRVPSAELRRRALARLRGGRGFLALVACLAASLYATAVAASDDDGITLSVVAGSGQVNLTWSGGMAPYGVYSSSSPSGLVSAANLAAVTGMQQWSEIPVGSAIRYYEVRVHGCTAAADCASGHCVDSVCCDAACSGTCESCNLPSTEGTCAPVPAGQDPDLECGATRTCDGQQGCTGQNGAACVRQQWAVGAVASSEYPGWEAIRATGEPDTGACADVSTNWSPGTDGLDPEWLELRYATPVRSVGVRIYEAFVGGFVTRIDLIDTAETLHNVWEGTDTTGCPGILEPTWPATPYAVVGVVVHTAVDGWEEIDAVELIEAEACLSGVCADGVCCDSGCAGICEACDLSGWEGTCTPIPRGQDPVDECVPGQACDGAGACASCPAEICDGLDNDCDGFVDNGNPGSGLSCSTGLLGVCAAGTTQCQSGGVVCVQNNLPCAEILDALDNDCDGMVDEGNNDRVWPCSQRQTYLDCRPYANAACILGTGPCECNWDAVYLLLDGSDKCPLSNEAEPKYDECLTGPFCRDIPCQDRVVLSQCRPDDCASRGECTCGWDAVNIGPNPYPADPDSPYYTLCSTQPAGFTCDYCAGANESDPCHVQIEGAARFCYDLWGGCGGGGIMTPPPGE